MLAIKGLGRSTIDAVVAERKENGPYKDLNDLCRRLYGKDVGRKNIESLIRCGALDCFPITEEVCLLLWSKS